MRIGIVYSTLTPGGGTYQCLLLARALSKGNDVIVFTYRDLTNGVYSDLTKDIKLFSISKRNSSMTNRFMDLFRPLFEQIRLASVISKHDIDILNPHEWPAQWSCAMVKICKNIPLVWTVNDVWHIPGFEETPERRKLPKLFNRTLGAILDRFFSKKVDKITVLDNRIKRIAKAHYKKDTLVIRSGIESKNFQGLGERLAIRKYLDFGESFVFLCVSIFFPHRRFEDAIHAFKNVHSAFANTKLIIIGDAKHAPTYVRKIEGLVQTLGLLDNVELITTFVSWDVLHNYYLAADAFVFPNERQTWGLAVLEAMAAARPCIVSDGSGVSEVIEDEKTGLIFKTKDVPDLAEKMKSILQNKKKGEEIGNNARAFVKKNFTFDTYASTMNNLFSNLLQHI